MKHQRMKDTPDKRRWYRKYARELDEMQGKAYNKYKADQSYDGLITDGCNFWISVKHKRKAVGFFTICPFPYCPPDVDYLLQDAYIQPESRRLGAMKKALTRWIEFHPGKYELLVLDDNKPAYNCWYKIFEDAGYIVYEQSSQKESSGRSSTLFRFKPKEESPLNLNWHLHREQLYLEYKKEIDDIQGVPYDTDIYANDLLDFLDGQNEWIPVVYHEEEVGFVCMCAHPCCHPDTEWFLREAYVRPEYRRKGLMQKTILKWLKKHPGRYCLFILDDNDVAQKCWHNVFQRAGYIPMNLRELPELNDITVKLYGFQPIDTPHR